MDLMYGSGPDYDLSLQEMIEGDLKSGDDFLGKVPYSSEDFLDMQMGDFGSGGGPGLFGEYGFEELGMHFDSSENLYLDGLSDHHHVSVVSNPSTKSVVVGTTSSSGGGGVVKSAGVGVPRHSRQSSINKSTSSVYVTSWNSLLNRSDVSKGISFEESLGIMVDPSSIVPASLSGSTGSSSIGSETDPECLATDDESESELASGSIAAWIVPETVSRSPSPAEGEFELEEPEFLLRGSGSQSVNEPPAKKRKQKHDPQPHPIDGKIYPKPGFSYSCLIAMSLKNSKTGCLPVSEIYKFMCDHFPYFKTAPSGWKNSVRHNLSLNKCFEKIEKPGNGARKGCLWALNPNKVHKMDEEVQKWSRKDPLSIRRAMSDPENLELLERGELKKDYSGNGSDEDEDEEFSEASGSVNPAQLIVRKINGQTTSVTSPVQYTTVSQVHASMNRPADQKIHVAKKDEALEFGTITNVQGNYICTTPGAQTYTLSFSNLGSSTPIIIRRTQVK